MDGTLGGDLTTPIVGRFALTEMRDQGIDHHVARPCVVGVHILFAAPRGQNGDVRDSADVQSYAGFARIAQQKKINQWDERRPATSCRDIAFSKV